MTLFRVAAYRACLALLCLAGSACAPSGKPFLDPSSNLQLVADSTLQELGPQAQAAWKFYAILKAKVIEKTPGLVDDYWIEAASRDALARYWDEEREDGGEAAAGECLGHTLAELAGAVLGPGDWAPRPQAWSSGTEKGQFRGPPVTPW